MDPIPKKPVVRIDTTGHVKTVNGIIPVSRPSGAYFNNEKNMFLHGFNPVVREPQEDIRAAWDKSASRTLSAFHNSGFMAGIVEVAAGSTVGQGLRMAARPDGETLGWTPKETERFTRDCEARFRAWARDKRRCDASGMLNFNQMQQVVFASYLAYGEALTLYPMFEREGTNNLGRLALLPPTRLANKNDDFAGVVQGIRVSKQWGEPLAYFIRLRNNPFYGESFDDVEVQAYDRAGRPKVTLIKDPSFTGRGISPFAPVLKAYRQADQYFDANMTAAMLQNIFAATLKSNIMGPNAWDALLTPQDQSSVSSGPAPFSSSAFAMMKGEWYDGAKIDLAQHGRIAHLFPGDELQFNKPQSAEQQVDSFMSWLLRDISRGAGVTYESASNDYRHATYSSVRMSGAIEWLTVMRRRNNIVVPWCDTAYQVWMDEEIATGRLEYKGGYEAFEREKDYATKETWTGPAKPQADEFKAARAFEVRKKNFNVTLAEGAEEYGQDWDDIARQQARERALYKDLNLPDPWAATTPLELEGGEEATLNEMAPDPSERKDSKKPGKSPRKSGGGRPDPERDPADAELKAELDASLVGE